jgi:F0F1-type ATP synthase delta subunit
MEEAIAKAARSRYGAETDVHAEIDPRTGASFSISSTTRRWRDSRSAPVRGSISACTSVSAP